MHRNLARCMLSVAALPLLTTALLQTAAAQSDYAFAIDSAPYEELTDAVELPIEFGNASYYLDMNGEVFRFFGRDYPVDDTPGLRITGRGFLRFEDDNTMLIVDGLLNLYDSLDTEGSVSYSIEGDPGSLVLTVQWKNGRYYNVGPTERVNVQIRIYQKSGVVETHYGPNTVAPGYIPAGHVGLFRAPLIFNTVYQKIWVHGLPESPELTRSQDFNFPELRHIPAEGTIYRFTPVEPSSAPESSSENDALLLLPNPARERLDILLKDNRVKAHLTLTDVHGIIHHSQEFNRSRTSLNLADLAAGVYFLSIRRGDNRITRRFVKQ